MQMERTASIMGKVTMGRMSSWRRTCPRTPRATSFPEKCTALRAKKRLEIFFEKKIVEILGAWDQKEKRCRSGIPNVYAEGTTNLNARVSKDYNGLKKFTKYYKQFERKSLFQASFAQNQKSARYIITMKLLVQLFP